MGAIGYLLKDTESEKLREAIRAAAAGQVQLSPEVAIKSASRLEPQQEYPGHSVLQSMLERLLKVEGSSAVKSKPGDGTRIRVWIPVQKKGNA